ncbi:MAG: hypothetical protein CVV41_22705 [Candidatus Riflebacteria bacterium HGW-Riflebacteria-1]|jgi:hypothetical protein|nr:MAG: hypothetical protein CVV41_22705 [Candidatus Riflebacteria bacterium HGW-Riflebacteria-1]
MTKSEEFTDKRHEQRIAYSCISLPFLGIRLPDHIQFQFLLVDASASGVQIAIPDWVIEWDRFVDGEELRLCLPVTSGENTLETCRVTWQKDDQATNEQFVGLVQLKKSFSEPIFKIDEFGMIELSNSGLETRSLVLRLLKDSAVLKRGVLIYLEHFLPYFSRIARDFQHYDEIRGFMLEDTLKLVKSKIKQLEDLHGRFVEGFADNSLATTDVDMNSLRDLYRSEVSNALFKMTFPDQLLLNYIEEIKNLELRLFTNYNALVTLYSMALEESLG